MTTTTAAAQSAGTVGQVDRVVLDETMRVQDILGHLQAGATDADTVAVHVMKAAVPGWAESGADVLQLLLALQLDNATVTEITAAQIKFHSTAEAKAAAKRATGTTGADEVSRKVVIDSQERECTRCDDERKLKTDYRGLSKGEECPDCDAKRRVGGVGKGKRGINLAGLAGVSGVVNHYGKTWLHLCTPIVCRETLAFMQSSHGDMSWGGRKDRDPAPGEGAPVERIEQLLRVMTVAADLDANPELLAEVEQLIA